MLGSALVMLRYSILQTQERDFVLKLSALEIYNETVVDLLNRDSGCLRLLDDPEVYRASFHFFIMTMNPFWDFEVFLLEILFCKIQKGTIVEKLVEEVVKDSQHLRHLIGICEGNFIIMSWSCCFSSYVFIHQYSWITPSFRINDIALV